MKHEEVGKGKGVKIHYIIHVMYKFPGQNIYHLQIITMYQVPYLHEQHCINASIQFGIVGDLCKFTPHYFARSRH